MISVFNVAAYLLGTPSDIGISWSFPGSECRYQRNEELQARQYFTALVSMQMNEDIQPYPPQMLPVDLPLLLHPEPHS